jgi:hypothetical protein
VLGGGLRDVRPLVVSSSCEFLASAMLHTCLKLQQPAPTRRSDQLTYYQPEALVQAATFKSHCHSRLTLPLHLGGQVGEEVNGIQTNYFQYCYCLVRCCDVAVCEASMASHSRVDCGFLFARSPSFFAV